MATTADPDEAACPSASVGVIPIHSARVLMVGAGGIGCELLKNIVLSGFTCVHVLDLDTIETSNLNRQFLFRKRHVGKSKAAIACEAAREMLKAANRSNEVEIVSYHANIMEQRFDLDFFASFNIVLNGLDNVEARRHVNKMCVNAGVPLVESGTAGYLGQATVHNISGSDKNNNPFAYSCFDCHPRPSTAKQYPICTIRNTPDKPIHCIVWAKDILFKRLLGPKDAVTDLDNPNIENNNDSNKENEENSDDAENAGKAHKMDNDNGKGNETQAEDDEEGVHEDTASLSYFLKEDNESSEEYAIRIFKRVFQNDIEKLIDVKDMWENKVPPQALVYDQFEKVTPIICKSDSDVSKIDATTTSAAAKFGLKNTQQLWSRAENCAIFIETIKMFYDTHRCGDIGSLEFDKDDDLAVELVTSAANLRMMNYNMEKQNLSMFDAKGMAGNIIHAIATTNAIISGLIVLEAKKILRGESEKCKRTFLFKEASNNKLLLPTTPDEPNPSCAVCKSTKARLVLEIDTESATFGTVINGLLKQEMGLEEPSVYFGDNLLYDEDEDDPNLLSIFESQMSKKLCAMVPPLLHGSCIEVEDMSEEFEARIFIKQKKREVGEDRVNGEKDLFVIRGEWESYKGRSKMGDENGMADAEEEKEEAIGGRLGNDDQEELCIVLDDDDDDDDKKIEKRSEMTKENSRSQVIINDSLILNYIVVGSHHVGNDALVSDTEAMNPTHNFDVINGVYEGGYKLWEGAIDVIKYLHTMNQSDMANTDVRESHSINCCFQNVIELGCGHALPGIACLKYFNAQHVLLQDFNAGVLQSVSAKNVELNFDNPDRLCHKIRYACGDWVTMRSFLKDNHELNTFDLVVSSETAYNVLTIPYLVDAINAVCNENYASNCEGKIECACVHEWPTIKSILRDNLILCLSPTGICIISTKRYYFGVGGGTAELLKAVAAYKDMISTVVDESCDGTSNVRDIVLIRFRHHQDKS